MEENILLNYLKEVKANGISTVIGAAFELERRFGITHDEAIKIIKEWNRIYGFTH